MLLRAATKYHDHVTILYGANPYQKPAQIFGTKVALNLPADAFFKYLSPAEAASGLPLNDIEKKEADRISSFGDWITLSDIGYNPIAKIISRELTDGVIAPGYDAQVLKNFKQKKDGKYIVIQIDPNYEPLEIETHQSLLTISSTEA
ncbi:phosphoribosylaminoimidazolecarboxamide formyltransferase/IMP cyclohydrolase [Gigaspora margarita]|uniref:Phosphoribosylaminoimidazolecarboxamide formyltransferase/IMP cyclohydrolase n=1 Tax=Gigaspora margarita TaxID=4874 RepID=A0A8H4ANI9_GIGMA|nr:phosphoribosylaminoimidazolecarboxamide formyltransferase/IMP cyclohydrolase [Gigaspora margarita]